MNKLVAVLILALGVTAQARNRSEVSVKVTGLRNAQGSVRVSIYRDKHGFPSNTTEAVRSIQAEIVDGAATAVFADLEEGSYAVAAFHDENGNGKYEAKKEGIGTSANEGVAFQNAKFSLTGNKTIEIHVHYPDEAASRPVIAGE
jgi:uncharacterized protein (DUF2141 family)